MKINPENSFLQSNTVWAQGYRRRGSMKLIHFSKHALMNNNPFFKWLHVISQIALQHSENLNGCGTCGPNLLYDTQNVEM